MVDDRPRVSAVSLAELGIPFVDPDDGCHPQQGEGLPHEVRARGREQERVFVVRHRLVDLGQRYLEHGDLVFRVDDDRRVVEGLGPLEQGVCERGGLRQLAREVERSDARELGADLLDGFPSRGVFGRGDRRQQCARIAARAEVAQPIDGVDGLFHHDFVGLAQHVHDGPQVRAPPIEARHAQVHQVLRLLVAHVRRHARLLSGRGPPRHVVVESVDDAPADVLGERHRGLREGLGHGLGHVLVPDLGDVARRVRARWLGAIGPPQGCGGAGHDRHAGRELARMAAPRAPRELTEQLVHRREAIARP